MVPRGHRSHPGGRRHRGPSAPGNTFLALAEIVGWLLLAKGLFDIVIALANRYIELWWVRFAIA